MRIGILGTRGIPNQYGGFEQFTEYVAPALVSRGHEVFVYNPADHAYQETLWKGVHIIRQPNPEKRIGAAGQFTYDLNCLLDARKRDYDVILQLGYTSSSIWSFLRPRRPVLATNMDGLEWKRAKYSPPVRFFLRRAERWAALYSDTLIADSKGIQAYLLEKYNKRSELIAYGASLFENPDEKTLARFDLAEYTYNILIARMEPENNIETIIKGHLQSAGGRQLLVIGNYSNKFGSYLKKKYESSAIRFPGAIYDIEVLNNLRHFSHFYFHGHSVGGTNPSLLEAMASGSLIVAHDNVFNRSVLEDDAFYFSGENDISGLLERTPEKEKYIHYLDNNKKKIAAHYSWEHITSLLENHLLRCIQTV